MKTYLLLLRRSILFVFSFSLLAGFLATGSFAATYYISPSGNDATGNGSQANPWKSLYKATSAAKIAGDIIHVGQGTYTETQGSVLAARVSIEGEGLSTTIINSTLTGTWSTFLQLSSSNGTNGGQSISGLTLDGGGYSYIVDCIIRKNLFSNMYAGTGIGNRFGIGVISDGPNDPQINNMQIYNNTLVAKSGDPTYMGLDFTSQSNGDCRGLYIRNNIVNGFSNAWLKGSNGATNISDCFVTHNDAFGNGGGNTPGWPGGNPASYTYNNNLSVNPQFVSATDYHLQPGSPVIDRGVNVGIPFNGNAPDMGYAEFGFGGPFTY